MSKQPLYRLLAQLVQARANCIRDGDKEEWRERHEDRILQLVKEHMPSGSGLNCGTSINLFHSTGNKLVFHTSFHHMDEGGGYAGWTDHVVTVAPSLSFDFELAISGRNRNAIKEYLYEIFRLALDQEVE